MSVMGLKKKSFGWGWVGGWGEFYPSFFLYFWNFFNFAKPLTHHIFHVMLSIPLVIFSYINYERLVHLTIKKII